MRTGRFTEERMGPFLRDADKRSGPDVAWRCHYNEVRPHLSLGYRTPRSSKRRD